jgi:tetratricopeptide (TPR) repeat protein
LSLLRYEEREAEGLFLPSQSAVYGGTWAGVPRILGHLNLSRERFREHFPFSIVFCLPEFALRYFIRRAPDFFDWRSGIYEFPLDQDTLSKELKEKLAELKAYLSDSPNLEKYKASELWFEMGLVFAMVGEQIKAISAFDRVLQFYPDEYNALYNKGVALEDLGRYEESITAYDNVLKMRPSDYEAWNSRGLALFNLDRYEEAIASYDNALKIKPDYHEAWYNRGNALGNLGRNEEAITSYDNALKFKSDKYKAWNHRGNALLVPMPYKKIALAIENLKGCDL